VNLSVLVKNDMQKNTLLLQVNCHNFFLTIVAPARVWVGWGTHKWQAAQTDMIVMGSVSMKKMGYQDPAPASNLVDQPHYLQFVQASSHCQINNFFILIFLASFIDSAYVSIVRNSEDIIFKTDIGTFSCSVGSATTEGETIECSEQVDQEAGGWVKSSLF
jgi:hypothetical protein